MGAGAGIAYLLDGSYEAVANTVRNAVAILSGTICDGAKPSCAAKIAEAVDAGIMGYNMYKTGNNFNGGDGIVGPRRGHHCRQHRHPRPRRHAPDGQDHPQHHAHPL